MSNVIVMHLAPNTRDRGGVPGRLSREEGCTSEWNLPPESASLHSDRASGGHPFPGRPALFLQPQCDSAHVEAIHCGREREEIM